MLEQRAPSTDRKPPPQQKQTTAKKQKNVDNTHPYFNTFTSTFTSTSQAYQHNTYTNAYTHTRPLQAQGTYHSDAHNRTQHLYKHKVHTTVMHITEPNTTHTYLERLVPAVAPCQEPLLLPQLQAQPMQGPHESTEHPQGRLGPPLLLHRRPRPCHRHRFFAFRRC